VVEVLAALRRDFHILDSTSEERRNRPRYWISEQTEAGAKVNICPTSYCKQTIVVQQPDSPLLPIHLKLLAAGEIVRARIRRRRTGRQAFFSLQKLQVLAGLCQKSICISKRAAHGNEVRDFPRISKLALLTPQGLLSNTDTARIGCRPKAVFCRFQCRLFEL
jgi:hypothetical protein